MKNKIVYIFGGLLIAIVAVVVFVFIGQSISENKLPSRQPSLKTKLQQCPDEWIDNKMPSTDSKKSKTQYFILNGERRELNEFDMNWVQKNCDIKKQTVF